MQSRLNHQHQCHRCRRKIKKANSCQARLKKPARRKKKARMIRMSNATVAGFNYLHGAAESSLYRNGKVMLRRDADGNDHDIQGLMQARHQMPVQDARDAENLRASLAQNGFELIDSPLDAGAIDFFDQQSVLQHYYPQCERIVQAVSGGRAFAFDHNVRSAREKQVGRRIAGGQQVQEPLQLVHGDYTLTSAPQRLRDLANPPSLNDTLRRVLADGESLISKPLMHQALGEGGRFAIINVWRSIAPEPVARLPLALCDAQSVRPKDLVVFELHYQDRIGENYFAKHAARHRWFHYPAMSRDEALLIKQWDCAGAMARSNGEQADADHPQAPSTFSFHSAFDHPETARDAPDRQSIEVRCMVIYD